MTIWAASVTITNNPPGQLTIQTPVGSASSIIQVRLSNNTPFAFTVNVDDPGSSPILQPFTQNVYPYSYLRGNIVVTAGVAIANLVLQSNMQIMAEYSDNETDLAGTYPAPLGVTFTTINSGSITADITGPVSVINEGGTLLSVGEQIYQIGTFASTYAIGTTTTNFTLQPGTCGIGLVRHLGGVSGNWQGIQVQFVGGSSGLTYYQGRPFAKTKGPLPLPGLMLIATFAGDIEGASLNMNFVVTGATATFSGMLIGFLNNVPAWTPPQQPDQSTSTQNNSAAVGTDILPQLTDGSSYLVASAWMYTPAAGVGFIYLGGVNGARIIQGFAGVVPGPIACNELTLISGNAADTVMGGCVYGYADY